jgi:hypothetical protein
MTARQVRFIIVKGTRLTSMVRIPEFKVTASMRDREREALHELWHEVLRNWSNTGRLLPDQHLRRTLSLQFPSLTDEQAQRVVETIGGRVRDMLARNNNRARAE